MGQRGRAPEPAALRILKGETRPSQLNTAPQPQSPPIKPPGLSTPAAVIWDRVLLATAHTSHIGPGHAEAFRQYCEATAAEVAIPEKEKGSRAWCELAALSLKYARELCLTPATGAALRAKPNATKLDRYIARTG